jgi:copper(I)-binding protein
MAGRLLCLRRRRKFSFAQENEMTARRTAIALFILGLSAAPAWAADVSVGSLEISTPWARATPPGAPTGGGYLTITNHGTTADVLVGVATPDAATSELHSMTMANGIAQMRAVTGGVPIAAGGSVTLDPNGLHVMFVRLTHALQAGGMLPVTLTFKDAGRVTIEMPILPIGSMGPAAGN